MSDTTDLERLIKRLPPSVFYEDLVNALERIADQLDSVEDALIATGL